MMIAATPASRWAGVCIIVVNWKRSEEMKESKI